MIVFHALQVTTVKDLTVHNLMDLALQVIIVLVALAIQPNTQHKQAIIHYRDLQIKLLVNLVIINQIWLRVHAYLVQLVNIVMI